MPKDAQYRGSLGLKGALPMIAFLVGLSFVGLLNSHASDQIPWEELGEVSVTEAADFHFPSGKARIPKGSRLEVLGDGGPGYLRARWSNREGTISISQTNFDEVVQKARLTRKLRGLSESLGRDRDLWSSDRIRSMEQSTDFKRLTWRQSLWNIGRFAPEERPALFPILRRNATPPLGSFSPGHPRQQFLTRSFGESLHKLEALSSFPRRENSPEGPQNRLFFPNPEVFHLRFVLSVFKGDWSSDVQRLSAGLFPIPPEVFLMTRPAGWRADDSEVWRPGRMFNLDSVSYLKGSTFQGGLRLPSDALQFSGMRSGLEPKQTLAWGFCFDLGLAETQQEATNKAAYWAGLGSAEALEHLLESGMGGQTAGESGYAMYFDLDGEFALLLHGGRSLSHRWRTVNWQPGATGMRKETAVKFIRAKELAALTGDGLVLWFQGDQESLDKRGITGSERYVLLAREPTFFWEEFSNRPTGLQDFPRRDVVQRKLIESVMRQLALVEMRARKKGDRENEALADLIGEGSRRLRDSPGHLKLLDVVSPARIYAGMDEYLSDPLAERPGSCLANCSWRWDEEIRRDVELMAELPGSELGMRHLRLISSLPTEAALPAFERAFLDGTFVRRALDHPETLNILEEFFLEYYSLRGTRPGGEMSALERFLKESPGSSDGGEAWNSAVMSGVRSYLRENWGRRAGWGVFMAERGGFGPPDPFFFDARFPVETAGHFHDFAPFERRLFLPFRYFIWPKELVE